MSKSRKPTGMAWGEASDELKAKVKLVLQMAQNNRYSVSRIYAAHNGVFGLKEQPETCSTCLTSREKNLRKWWAENAPSEAQDARQPIIVDGVADLSAVPTTGDKHTPLATPFKVLAVKYGLDKDGNESSELGKALAEGNPLGLSPEDLTTASALYDQLAAELEQQDGAALEAFYAAHEAKLAELGVTHESSDEDMLEALEVLNASDDATEEERAHYAVQIPFLTQRIADANVVAFTAEQEGAAYGTATKGGQPLPEGVYEHEGKRYQVTGADGRYTELAADEEGHDPKAPQTHFFKEGEMSMTFTPNADDVKKGVVAWQDGSKVKAGTYTTATGVNIAVQVGSKASIK